MLKHFLLIFCLCTSLPGQGQQVPIGTWQEHFPWRFSRQLAFTGNHILCTTEYGVYSIAAADNNIQRYHKINGLSGVRVQASGFDAATGQLILVHDDGGIDVLKGSRTTYIPDFKTAASATDKSVNHICCSEGKAYLATGFGILVINLNKYVPEDTWRLGGNNPLKVNATAINDGYYYAATEAGLLRTSVAGTNPADFSTWEKLPGTPDTAFHLLAIVGGKLYAAAGNNIYTENNGAAAVFFTSPATVQQLGNVEENLFLIEDKKFHFLNENAAIARTIQHPALPAPVSILSIEGALWAADAEQGLLRSDGSNWVSFTPNAPNGNVSGRMVFNNRTLYATSGTVLPNGTGTENQDGFFVWEEGSWRNYIPGMNLPENLTDLHVISINKNNGNAYMGSWGEGILEVKSDASVSLLKGNANLPASLLQPGEYRIGGLLHDQQNRLWATTDGAATILAFRLASGAFTRLGPPFSLSRNAVSQIIEDDAGQLWIISPGNGLLCLNHNNTPEQTSDDRWKLFRAGAGNGNLPDNTVYCLSRDRNGFVWIGTNRGIGIMRCPSLVFSPNACEVFLPIVQQDNFAGYLFQNEKVHAIATDGANRKWAGTENGLWLINPEGERVLSRFTTENSPLPGNQIHDIAIDPVSGTVFIATNNGLCSFRSDATTAPASDFSVKIFPNPVPPGFTGTIGIRDLPEDAIVKITEPNGRLVFQTKALGGQATWNGKDPTGRSVASGVYLVLVTDATRKENLAGKIVIASR